jgi:hypothetical protein
MISRTPAESQSTALQLTTALLIAFAIAFFVYYGVSTINDPVFSIDFLPYHVAARLLAAGNVQALTDFAEAGGFLANAGPFLDDFHRYFFADSPVGTRWIYLPAYIWIFHPLAGLEFHVAAHVWLAVNIALALLCVGLLWSARPWRGDPRLSGWRFAWIAFMGLAFQPVLDNMWHGNISALIFVCFCLSYWLLRRDRPFLAGLALGLIVPLKFYPGLFVLYFAWRRNWLFVAGTAISSVVIFVLSLFTVGWAGNLAYFQMIWAELQSGGIPAFNNQSIDGFLLHAFTQGDVNGWLNMSVPVSLTIARLALVLVLIAAVAWALRRRPEGTADATSAQDLDLALVISVMLLASPITWYHYYIWLLFPLIVMFDVFASAAAANTRRVVWLAIGYGLVVVQGISMIRPFAAQAIQDVWVLRVLLSLSFFGATILTGLLLRLRLEAR